MRTHWRFAVVAAVLACTAIILHARNRAEIIPPRTPLASFPNDFDGWNGSDRAMTQDQLDVLGPGDFLLRDYVNPAQHAGLNLFIAYFPSQRTGDAIHSPKNCLPGSGWAPVSADHVMMNIPGRAPFSVNRYLIAKGDEQQLVLYWYWAHNRAVASEYTAKLYLVSDSIRMRRSDGALIRLVAPIAPNESLESAQNVLISFAGKVMSRIDAYVPR
jgi:EpsI family protein